jgi:hypothetical protein
MRINRETQTGDVAFDERVYLESEAPDAVVLAVLVDPIMRAGALKCFALGCTSLTLDDDGNLVVELPLATDAAMAPDFLASVLDTLAATAEAIPPLQGKGRHRGVAGRIPLFAFVGAIVSIPLYYLVDWLWEPLGSDLYVSAGLGGLALWLASLPILILILRGRATSLRDLLTSGISLAIVLPLGGADVLLILNGLLDTSPYEVHATHVTGPLHTTGKYASNHVTFDSWHPGKEAIDIKISSDLYATLWNGQAYTVTTRRGFLGWERITAMGPPTAPRTSN